jgi:hypothetical protein
LLTHTWTRFPPPFFFSLDKKIRLKKVGRRRRAEGCDRGNEWLLHPLDSEEEEEEVKNEEM